MWIRDLTRSPFNIAESSKFQLQDLSPGSIGELNRAYRSPLSGDKELDQLHDLVGGHPYLVQQSLYYMHSRAASIGDLEKVVTSPSGPYGDHLRYLLHSLERSPNIRPALTDVLKNGRCSDERDFQQLTAAGLVSGDSRNKAAIRYEIYRRYCVGSA